MIFGARFANRHMRRSGVCFNEKEGQKGGGGGTTPPDPAKELADLKAKNDALAAELAALKNPNKDKDKEDPSLAEKAAKERERADAEAAKSKRLESAIKFDLNSEKFLKDHSNLLPADVKDLFTQAGKENYADAIEKDAAIKSGMIQSFFSVQANVDLLTAGQKTQLDDYLKLTKTGKQEKAQSIYEMIFEPAFEMLKRVKKAEALQKGHGSGDDDDYKKRLVAGSRKHYLGEQKNA